MYAIAKRFSMEARLAAASRKYFGFAPPRTTDNYCPLGVMMEVDNAGELVWFTPLESEVVLYFKDKLTPESFEEQQEEIYEDAYEFIDVWDMGGISDLAQALGVNVHE